MRWAVAILRRSNGCHDKTFRDGTYGASTTFSSYLISVCHPTGLQVRKGEGFRMGKTVSHIKVIIYICVAPSCECTDMGDEAGDEPWLAVTIGCDLLEWGRARGSRSECRTIG